MTGHGRADPLGARTPRGRGSLSRAVGAWADTLGRRALNCRPGRAWVLLEEGVARSKRPRGRLRGLAACKRAARRKEYPRPTRAQRVNPTEGARVRPAHQTQNDRRSAHVGTANQAQSTKER